MHRGGNRDRQETAACSTQVPQKAPSEEGRSGKAVRRRRSGDLTRFGKGDSGQPNARFARKLYLIQREPLVFRETLLLIAPSSVVEEVEGTACWNHVQLLFRFLDALSRRQLRNGIVDNVCDLFYVTREAPRLRYYSGRRLRFTEQGCLMF